MTFEEVAGLLWETGAEGDWTAPELGECPLVEVSDRMRWALVMCGATDPSRADLSPAAVTRDARRVIAALADVVARSTRKRRSPTLHRHAPGGASGWPGGPAVDQP